MSVWQIHAEQTRSVATFQDRFCVSVKTDSSRRVVPKLTKIVEEAKQKPAEQICLNLPETTNPAE